MPVELRYSKHANQGWYNVQYYCYSDKCPIRTEKEPWPRSDGYKKKVVLTSKKGNKYNRYRWFCDHCDGQMDGVVNANDFA